MVLNCHLWKGSNEIKNDRLMINYGETLIYLVDTNSGVKVFISYAINMVFSEHFMSKCSWWQKIDYIATIKNKLEMHKTWKLL